MILLSMHGPACLSGGGTDARDLEVGHDDAIAREGEVHVGDPLRC